MPPPNNGLAVGDDGDPSTYGGAAADERDGVPLKEGDEDLTMEGDGDPPPDRVVGAKSWLRALADVYGELMEKNNEEHMEIMDPIRQVDGNSRCTGDVEFRKVARITNE